MKKSLFKILFLLSGILIFAQNNNLTAKKLDSLYKSEFFPGVVTLSDKILSEQNEVADKENILLTKAKALFKMQDFSSAEKVFLSIENASPLILAQKSYFLGKINFQKENFQDAEACFIKAIWILQKNNFAENENELKNELLTYSHYFLAESAFNQNDFKTAQKSYEFTLQNGKFLTKNEIEKASTEFLTLCIKNKDFTKAQNYAELLVSQNFSFFTQYKILLLCAEIYEEQKNFKKSFDYYLKVMEEGPDELKTFALKKAYALSEKKSDEVKMLPDEILSQAKSSQSFSPSLIAEFYVRLAIDEFGKENYRKSSEYFKIAENDLSPELKVVSAVYISNIDFIQLNSSKKAEVENAEKCALTLEEFQKKENLTEKNKYYFEFQKQLCLFYLLSKNWNSALAISENCLQKKIGTNLKEDFLYFAGISSFNLKDYEKSLSFAEKSNQKNDKIQLLKAKNYLSLGKNLSGIEILTKLEKNNLLNENSRLDFSKVLLKSGKLNSALKESLKVNGSESSYLSAIAYFNKKNFEESEIYFQKAIDSNELEKKFENYAIFYLAYSQYRLEKYKKALENFISFTNQSKNFPLLRQASIFASECALQTNDFVNAKKMAQNVVDYSSTEKEKRESVFFNAKIFVDSGDDNLALELLLPYTNQKNEFAFQCLFLCAEIYVKKGEIQNALDIYKTLSEQKISLSFAEEALYRQGELNFSNKNYDFALKNFEDYIKKYPSSQYFEDSLFYAGLSLFYKNEMQKASLYFENLVQNKKSTYRFAALKLLIELNEKSKNYEKALFYTKEILSSFENQAKQEGFDKKLREISILLKGDDSKIILLEDKFLEAKKEKTLEGRKIGVELLENYAKQSFDRFYYDKIISLSKNMIQNFKDTNEENEMNAKVHFILAQTYRNYSENALAAENFLSSSNLFIKCGLNEESANSLYRACEAFDAAELKEDCKSTAVLLKKLYPSSQYAQKVEVFIK